MPKSLNVLFVATEAEPFAKTGSLGDLAGNLSKMVKEMGHEIRVMIPGYGFISERRHHLHHLLRMKNIDVPVGKDVEKAYIKSSYISCENKKVQVYFLSNDKYFNREGLYYHPDTKQYFADNDERFIFFCRGALETLKKLGWQPDVIHCNDWQCGLIPAYLKSIYKDDPFFRNTRTVFTAYSLASHGAFPKSAYHKSGLPSSMFSTFDGEHDRLNFLTAGIAFADVTTTFGTKADKLRDSSNNGFEELLKSQKRQIVSLTAGSNGSRHQHLAEKLISIYRELAKS
jgi:starch synthase